ncbi:MAG: 2,5-dihydroxypyridine 5,6-dioxygenase [Proteobacteria bacterium]|nr:2,5-dihydroxypyridine 5,6-dioxygenase [Pseudomonadota bacterium]
MAVSDEQLFGAWKTVLQLCKLRPGEFVTLLTSDDVHHQTLRAARLAASDLGGVVTVLTLPAMGAELSMSRDKTAYVGRTALAGNAAAMACLQKSDLVIDLMLLLFSKEQGEILAGGTRMLLAVEPPEVLVRLVPTEDDKRRVLAGARVLGAARTMHVTSAAGTALDCRLGDYPILTEYGFADEPGRWDHWPSGFLATWPNEGTANGRIVIDRGDIIIPFKSYAQAPVTLTVQDGYVRAIEGGFDAEFLRDYMESFRDPEVYAISHVGWGLQPRASWTALGLYDREATLAMDARAYAGNFLFSTGPNTEAGGTRDTPCHIDIPLRGCSVFLDDAPMVLDGAVVPAEQKA